MNHPPKEELFAFAAGRLPRERAAEVVAHFLQGCESCREETARINLWRLRLLWESRPPIRLRVDEDEARPALTEICLPLLVNR